MPWFIQKKGNQHCVIKGKRGAKGNETVTCHPNQDKAVAHMKALYMHSSDVRGKK